jgi:hypothetical protein
LGLREVLETPNLRVFSREVFIRIPIAVLDTLDTSIFDKAFAGLYIKWGIDFVREVHILSCSGLKIRKLLMLL